MDFPMKSGGFQRIRCPFQTDPLFKRWSPSLDSTPLRQASSKWREMYPAPDSKVRSGPQLKYPQRIYPHYGHWKFVSFPGKVWWFYIVILVYILWCHQTWLAGKSPNWMEVFIGQSAISMVHFPARHVWLNRRVPPVYLPSGMIMGFQKVIRIFYQIVKNVIPGLYGTIPLPLSIWASTINIQCAKHHYMETSIIL